MNESRGQELIVGCLTAATAIAAGSALVQGTGPGFRLVAGVTVTAVGLATLNMFQPELAGGFAVLILTATTFSYGGPLFDALGSAFGAGPINSSSGRVRSPNTLPEEVEA